MSSLIILFLSLLFVQCTSPQSQSDATVTGVTDTGDPVVDANVSIFEEATFYVDPNSDAAVQVAAWRTSRPDDADLLAEISTQPVAKWMGDWESDIQSAAAAYMTLTNAGGALPVFVAYNIPNRDCGSYSSGGAADDAAYLNWIQDFADGIGSRAAVVVLEPDATAITSCLSDAQKAARFATLSSAVNIFKGKAAIAVYIDAGHANWIDATTMAETLTEAGIANADGFALNVSNFYTNAENIAFGDAVSALTGGKHFIIDTSRNGNGSNGEWCNPSGRAIGTVPTTVTGNTLVDAFLWIKPPGESDGTCNGGPSAGTWWLEYALALVS